MLETSLNEFIQSHVPYHKVEQIKLFNDVIWDKKRDFSKKNCLTNYKNNYRKIIIYYTINK